MLMEASQLPTVNVTDFPLSSYQETQMTSEAKKEWKRKDFKRLD